MDKEKAFDKTPMPIYDEVSQQTWIKGIYEEPKASIIFNDGRLNTFPLRF